MSEGDPFVGGSFNVYIDARALEASKVWDDPEALLAVRNKLAEDLYRGYKLRDRMDHRLAGLGQWSKTLDKDGEAA